MLEVSRAEAEDEAELSLELSIGGSYGKCEKQRSETEEEISGAVDPCRRREIQAMRRLEARRKRDEKMRRLEEQQLEERAGCRKMREDEEFLDDKSCRRKESAAKMTDSVNNGKNVYLQPYPASFRPYVDNNVSRINVDRKVVGCNVSIEMSSSAISDYRSTSGRGGSTSDTGSHSSCMQATERQKSIAPNSDTWNKPEPRPTTMQVPKNMMVTKGSHCGTDGLPASSRSDALTTKPENPVSGLLKRQMVPMPCVTTTGNGSNGKTITGFLYRYTSAAEVRIVCVCHGISFSPAEFVEHAGGMDVSNPLQHITVIPASLGLRI